MSDKTDKILYYTIEGPISGDLVSSEADLEESGDDEVEVTADLTVAGENVGAVDWAIRPADFGWFRRPGSEPGDQVTIEADQDVEILPRDLSGSLANRMEFGLELIRDAFTLASRQAEDYAEEKARAKIYLAGLEDAERRYKEEKRSKAEAIAKVEQKFDRLHLAINAALSQLEPNDAGFVGDDLQIWHEGRVSGHREAGNNVREVLARFMDATKSDS